MPFPTPLQRPDIAAQLGELIDAPHFDRHAAMRCLQALPIHLGAECQATVDIAGRLVAAAGRGGAREAVTRYALAQVIVVLERERGVVIRPH